MPVPIQFMKMSLILLKYFLLQASCLGTQPHWALSLFWIPRMLPFLSRVSISPLPLCFRYTCHIFTARQGSLWPTHEDVELHVFLEMSRNVSLLFIWHNQHASCLAKAHTMHEDLRHLPPRNSTYTQKNKYIREHKNTYRSFLCVVDIKHFIAEWKFPFLFYVFENSNQRTLLLL